jgi:hypothetical protein
MNAFSFPGCGGWIRFFFQKGSFFSPSLRRFPASRPKS